MSTVVHRPSILLSQDENELVFSLIGPKCQSLATAVVQLFITEGPAHNEWKKKETGILCLIKDKSRRSYLFCLYCLNRKAVVWKHEAYLQIEYKNPRPFLHTFEAEEYMTAFSFANEDEARIFRSILIEKIELRKHKQEERRQRSRVAARANSISSSYSSWYNDVKPIKLQPSPPPAPTPTVTVTVPQPKPTSSGYNIFKRKKKKNRKFTKADISRPSNFNHLVHADKDEEMERIFSKAGISETQLHDEDTRKFIYDFIKTHREMDAVKGTLHHNTNQIRGPMLITPAAASPPSDAPPVPARNSAGQQRAPPSRALPPPPNRAVPPPPPSISATKNPPPPRPLQPPLTAPPSIPPPPPTKQPPAPLGVPAPPSPPPMLHATSRAPPAPPMLANVAEPTDGRAALMEGICNGNKNLKHVEVGAKSATNEGSRNNLLSEIRQGVELRSVTRSDSNPRVAPGPCGLAGALARALQERSRAIQSSEDEDSDVTTDDDDW